MKYIIGSRGSRLALAQTESVKEVLEQAYPEHEFLVRIIRTKGDRIQDRPLRQIGDKGLFVREIEEQLLEGGIDIAVHSMKDMPAYPAKGLRFARCWKREDARDVLILREKESLSLLPPGAVIGSGSMRRKFQLLKLRPDLMVVDIRGNVDTRLRKMEDQRLDGIVLAAAGMRRLGMEERITQYLDFSEMIPAPAQGLLAIEIREDDAELLRLLDAFADEESQRAAAAERGFLESIGGSCHVPIGAYYQRLEDGRGCLSCMFGNEDGSKIAYTQVVGKEPGKLAAAAVQNIRRKLYGAVTLVGAGPGDPELITVKGLKAVRKADCIIYDRLASPSLLAEARDGCEKIFAGKENRHHTMKQEEINQLLVEKALQYQNVVRLKGGDPYVFGRGGEEGLALAKEGIPFCVVPGISSSLAGLAYAGIPITHRGVASGFHVVTAHNKQDELAAIDFKAMAEGGDTCVFLMGLSKLPEIVCGLLEAGMRESMPAAVISHATGGCQKTIVAELSQLVERTEASGAEPPALIVVGEVVSLREPLNFFENRPLFGKRFLVTKVGAQVSRLTQKLEEAGALAEEFQTGEIVDRSGAFLAEELEKTDWLIFTSRNGVEAFFRELKAQNRDIRALGSVRAAAIGSHTAAGLEDYGIKADFLPSQYNSDSFVKEFKTRLKPGNTVAYVKAANAENGLREALEDCCSLAEWEVYENREVLEAVRTREELLQYDGVFFTCASSAERFFKAHRDAIPETWKNSGCVYGIGPKTCAALRRLGMERVTQAEKADYEALVEAVFGR